MTEREYVEAIRAVAERYLEVIRQPSAHEKDGWSRIKRWEAIKEKLSAHTAIDICTAWLDAQDAPTQPQSTSDVSAPPEQLPPASGEPREE